MADSPRCRADLAVNPASTPGIQRAPGPPAGSLGRGGLPPEDADCPQDDRFEDHPADQGGHGSNVEHRSTSVQGVGPKNPLERRDEDLADVEDRRDDVVAGPRIEDQQYDPQSDHDLDQAEDQDDHPTGEL